MKDIHGVEIKVGQRLDIKVQNGVVHGVVVAYKGSLGCDLGDTVWELGEKELANCEIITEEWGCM